jgi:hypothetical protein
MDKNSWEDFTNQVKLNLTKNNTPTDPNTNDSLETHWHKIQTSIITAALKIIPNKKLKLQNFHHTHSTKATQLHQNLKLIGQIIRQTKYALNNKLPIPTSFIAQIDKINEQQNLNIEQIPFNTTQIPTWLTDIQKHWKTLHKAREIENSIHI